MAPKKTQDNPLQKAAVPLLATLFIGVIALSQAFYIVDERQQAILLQLGQPVGDESDSKSLIKGPGLHFKLPFVQEVRYFDRRVLSVDPPADQVVVASQSSGTAEEEQQDELGIVTGEPIIVDTFARYKIVDPLQFLKTLRTVSNAEGRLRDILTNATRAVLGNTTLELLLSAQREVVMADIRERVNRNIEQGNLGIELVDVRIVRADLTQDLRTSTVRRMISELKERATETRAKGEERALEIRSTAEKERTVILAEAERDAQIIRGEGDEQSIKIYADAFNKDKQFYGFIRSMEAYGNTLSDPGTKLILSPDSDFLKFLRNRSGN